MEVTHVVVLGLMGAGKTGVGRRVAKALDRPFVDGDEELESRTGRTAAEIADSDGLDALHGLEAEILLEALDSGTPSVIGPAASTVESAACRTAMAGRAVVIWLSAPPAVLAERAAKKDHRPLVGSDDDLGLFERQRDVREPLALDLAALVIDRATTSKDEATEQVVALLRQVAPSSPPS